jgi:hypothetical protein
LIFYLFLKDRYIFLKFIYKYINGVFFCVQLLVFIAIFHVLLLFVTKKACWRMGTTCLNNLDLKTNQYYACGAFTLDVKLVLNENLSGILCGTEC